MELKEYFQFFSEEELSILREDALKTTENPRSLMTLLAMETGLRVGELAALHTADIEDGFIHVHRQQLRNHRGGKQVFEEVGYTKDERKHPHDGRYVPITEACANVLCLARRVDAIERMAESQNRGKIVPAFVDFLNWLSLLRCQYH